MEFEGLLRPEPEPARTAPPPARPAPPRRPAATPAPKRRQGKTTQTAPPATPDARDGVRLVQDVVEEREQEAGTPALSAADFTRLDRLALRRAILLKEILGPPRAFRSLDD